MRINTTERVQRLRDVMSSPEWAMVPLAAYIIPSNDEHNNICTTPSYQRLAYISGFRGDIGLAVVTPNEALLWTNSTGSRLASECIDDNWTLMIQESPHDPSWTTWLVNKLAPNSCVGADPKLFTIQVWNQISRDLSFSSIHLVNVRLNLVDLTWPTRPSRPKEVIHQTDYIKYNLASTNELVEGIRVELMEAGADCLVLTQPDHISWILNWTGTDLPYQGGFHSYVIIGMEEVDVFVDPEKIPDSVIQTLTEDTPYIRLHKYEDVKGNLEKQITNTSGKVWLGLRCNFDLASVVPEHRRIYEELPMFKAQSLMSARQIEGLKAASAKEAAVMCWFFSWLEELTKSRSTPNYHQAITKLEEMRRAVDGLVRSMPPFPIDLRNENAQLLQLPGNDVIVIISSAQYLQGSPNAKRTIHMGYPSEQDKRTYTRLLKEHIHRVNSIFPSRFPARNLRLFAMANIDDKPSDAPVPLVLNMTLASESDAYNYEDFRIRLSNAILVIAADKARFGWGEPTEYLTFEDMSLIPYQQSMIQLDVLEPIEIEYLNKYHLYCKSAIMEFMQTRADLFPPSAVQWLNNHTNPIGNLAFLQNTQPKHSLSPQRQSPNFVPTISIDNEQTVPKVVKKVKSTKNKDKPRKTKVSKKKSTPIQSGQEDNGDSDNSYILKRGRPAKTKLSDVKAPVGTIAEDVALPDALDPTKYPCTYCRKMFVNKNNLIVHLRTHTGERPFPCTYCDKTFTQKVHMIKHLHCVHNTSASKKTTG